VFGAAAFGGAALLSAFARMLFPLIPILLFVIFYGLRDIDLKRQS
jgi:hypothetical protein